MKLSKELISIFKEHSGLDLNIPDILSSDSMSDIKINTDNRGKRFIVNFEKINNKRFINKFHKEVNKKLSEQDLYISCGETLEQRNLRIQSNFFYGFRFIINTFDFIYMRIFPKIPILQSLYFYISKGQNRVISKAEMIGRLIFCGFKIQKYFEYKGLFFIISSKQNNLVNYSKSSYGVIFKMARVGYLGKIIQVYKFRTMHPYSEYCQDLIHSENNILDSGKFSNDFRITNWGKFFRKYWIDELPMIINFLKGELSIFGVRPLSISYYNKYPEYLQKQRIRYKPGLIPPYYSDLPKNFNEIIYSEKKYLDLKDISPIKTDIKYFLKALLNIFFKGARSS